MDAAAPARVLAILVAHDGSTWLPDSLASLRAQTYEHLEVVAVDNGSTDASRALLVEALGEERVLVAERDLGFAAAVSMALDARGRPDVDHLLFVHDDVALDADAVARQVAALEADPRLAIVGPKLVSWHDPSRLQHVGMSVDITGRAESGLEPDELDQGQRDQQRQTLYVSTAGMMVRRSVFEELGRFDRRYHLFRDDLDLCWRAWLAGHDVEVVPAARARHAAGATNYERLGQTAFLGPRYFAERNTLATLLKTYGAVRLLVVLPLFVVVGIAKVFGFIATRRLSDAWQTVRAWMWNVRHLRRTWRLRRAVQRHRVRTDAELRPLFARVAPRLRAYGEAMVDWIAGGEPDFDRDVPEPDAEPQTATHRVVAYVRRHPVTSTAVVLGLIGAIAAIPLLRAGPIRGGELAPWPEDGLAFLDAYVSSWHDAGGFGTDAAPSPAQAVLAGVSILSFGSAWLAPRLLVLATLPLAWLLALRAARVLTPKRLPRLAAATVYALSPPALAAVSTGRVGAMAATWLLPAIVIALGAMIRPGGPSTGAWRATAAGAVAAALLVAFEPSSLLAVLVALAAALGAAATGRDPARRRATVVRLTAFGVGVLALLLPWGVGLFQPGSPVFDGFGPPGAAPEPFWRWLLLAPDLPGFLGVLPGLGYVAAGVLGIVFGAAVRPRAVTMLWTVALAGVFAAWGLGRAGADAWTWPGAPLLLTAVALSGLLAVGLAAAGPRLQQHAFGWRQLGAVGTAALAATGVVAAAGHLASGPWDAYAVGAPALPTFLASESAGVGPFRVLVLAAGEQRVDWSLTGPAGPTMVSYGVPEPAPLLDLVDVTVEQMLAGTDAGAADRLGLANIRYVVVPPGGGSAALEEALAAQLDLEPQPVAAGRVYRVDGWLPRVAFVGDEAALAIATRLEVPRTEDGVPFERVDATSYVGAVPTSGAILVAESAANGWEATADGRSLEPDVHLGLMRFDVDQPAAVVEVAHDRQATRTAMVAFQLFLVLVAISLILRPPRFADREPLR